jgi:hypothetical protein
MAPRPICRFQVQVIYWDTHRPDRLIDWETREGALDQARMIYANECTDHVRVREFSADPNGLPKTIWRDGHLL